MEMSFAVGVIVIIIFYYLFLHYYFLSSKFSNRTPPQAGGAWPFIGHLHLMNGSKLPHITLGAMADKYGPIFTIRLGVRRALVVSSGELAKELFNTCDVAVSSRPKLAGPKHLGYDMAMIGFSPYNPYWRELRKLISTQLLSAHRLELQKHVLVSEIEQSINELYKIWSRSVGPRGRVQVEMKEWFGNLNLNVIMRMVAGKRCFGSSSDGDEARRCLRVMRDFFDLAGKLVVGDALPYLRWMDIGGYEKKMKETAKELDLLVGQWLEEHKQKGSWKKGQEDFMDVMLSLLQNTTLQSQYDADTIIKSTCANMISGASDTTSVMLIWALSLLLNNNNVLEKAQRELDHYIGKERRVNSSEHPQWWGDADMDSNIFLKWGISSMGG